MCSEQRIKETDDKTKTRKASLPTKKSNAGLQNL